MKNKVKLFSSRIPAYEEEFKKSGIGNKFDFYGDRILALYWMNKGCCPIAEEFIRDECKSYEAGEEAISKYKYATKRVYQDAYKMGVIRNEARLVSWSELGYNCK